MKIEKADSAAAAAVGPGKKRTKSNVDEKVVVQVKHHQVQRRRSSRRVQADRTAVQRLFYVSKAVFNARVAVPLPPHVTMLHSFLDKMKLEDFGLSTGLEFFKDTSPVNGTPTITYTSIYNCENFSLCMFFLPPTAVIPLHNHPGMTVFSKLLLGTMHIKSFDWVDDSASQETNNPSNLRLARKVLDSELSAPCNTCILYPAAGGNIHTFKAITACIVLDVLGPPYSKEEDRDCTYYRDHPDPINVSESSVGKEQDKGLCWLEEIEMPKDLKMVGVEYLGPQIIDRY